MRPLCILRGLPPDCGPDSITRGLEDHCFLQSLTWCGRVPEKGERVFGSAAHAVVAFYEMNVPGCSACAQRLASLLSDQTRRAPQSIYVASSWKNIHQPAVVSALRADGFDVYDFRSDESGFRWVDVAGPKPWSAEVLGKALTHPSAQRAFDADYEGMRSADAVVLVLDCGKSAHLEAGWFAGRGRPLVVYMPEPTEPELMYRLAPELRIVSKLESIASVLRSFGRRGL